MRWVTLKKKKKKRSNQTKKKSKKKKKKKKKENPKRLRDMTWKTGWASKQPTHRKKINNTYIDHKANYPTNILHITRGRLEVGV
jgi:hypothetical protein